MKKDVLLLRILFALVMLLSLGVILLACLGYTIELISYSAFAIITALVSVYAVTLDIKCKEVTERKLIQVLFALLPLFSLINAVYYIYKCSNICVIACMIISVICCTILAVRYGRPPALKIFSAALTALLICLFCFFGSIAYFFKDFSKNTVVKVVPSPNGEYYAEVVDNDQGALGGATVVWVYDSKGFNALLFKISSMPQRVHVGEWLEYEECLQIYWKDDSRIVINSDEYDIEPFVKKIGRIVKKFFCRRKTPAPVKISYFHLIEDRV